MSWFCPRINNFDLVRSTDSVQAEFTPTLKVYVNKDYKETGIIRGDISSLVLTQNIALLPEIQKYKLSMVGGSYRISPA
jgi:hypothetical protein